MTESFAKKIKKEKKKREFQNEKKEMDYGTAVSVPPLKASEHEGGNNSFKRPFLLYCLHVRRCVAL